MLLMIDNYDSFTYNLVQYLGELGANIEVYRNDKITMDEIMELDPKRIVISPGPCTPNEAGISVEVIQRFAGRVPLLGVCLGHQSLAFAFGGEIIRADRLMHGKTSLVEHDNQTIFQGLPNPFEATRYHSLIVNKDTLPGDFEISKARKRRKARSWASGIDRPVRKACSSIPNPSSRKPAWTCCETFLRRNPGMVNRPRHKLYLPYPLLTKEGNKAG